jgi:hypothetical protein
MATYAQRASSIVTAFLNRPATPTQVNKAARALAFRMQFTTQYDAMTADEKAEWYVKRMASATVESVKDMEDQPVAAAAVVQSRATIDNEWAETP